MCFKTDKSVHYHSINKLQVTITRHHQFMPRLSKLYQQNPRFNMVLQYKWGAVMEFVRRMLLFL